MAEQRNYTVQRWYNRDGVVVDVDERVVMGGDFAEWMDEKLESEGE